MNAPLVEPLLQLPHCISPVPLFARKVLVCSAQLDVEELEGDDGGVYENVETYMSGQIPPCVT